MSDPRGDELLDACRQGNRDALTELIHLYQDRLFRLAFRVCGDAELAEDAVARAFVHLWYNAKRWSGAARADTWIYRVAFNAAVDVRRKKERHRGLWFDPILDDVADDEPPPDEALAVGEERQMTADRLQDALMSLRPEDQFIVHLHYYEQRSLQEVADIVGATRDVVKTRLARARQRLRSILESFDGPNGSL